MVELAGQSHQRERLRHIYVHRHERRRQCQVLSHRLALNQRGSRQDSARKQSSPNLNTWQNYRAQFTATAVNAPHFVPVVGAETFYRILAVP